MVSVRGTSKRKQIFSRTQSQRQRKNLIDGGACSLVHYSYIRLGCGDNFLVKYLLSMVIYVFTRFLVFSRLFLFLFSLIKRVKSIHQKTQKIWMLMDLTPSANITGGPWYTDNDFDHEFVNEICKIAESQVCLSLFSHFKI
jgi:hypothetical protein